MCFSPAGCSLCNEIFMKTHLLSRANIWGCIFSHTCGFSGDISLFEMLGYRRRAAVFGFEWWQRWPDLISNSNTVKFSECWWLKCFSSFTSNSLGEHRSFEQTRLSWMSFVCSACLHVFILHAVHLQPSQNHRHNARGSDSSGLTIQLSASQTDTEAA